MKHVVVTLFATWFLACTTATPPPAPQPVCNPGHALVNSVLWVQTAAEYRAAALQTYAAARVALDQALADPAWVGAAEETGSDPAQPPAVILDVDETIIDNSAFEVRTLRQGKTFDEELWQGWTNEAAARAIPGAAEFLTYARSRGVTPFYVTNRDLEEGTGTRSNLQNLGFPLGNDPDTLLLKGGQSDWGSDKSSRRVWVARSYRVLLLLGDDLNDFANARGKSLAERDAIIERTKSWWGTKWFMVPNPMYGSWEGAAVTSGGTPCEQLQKKVDALRE